MTLLLLGSQPVRAQTASEPGSDRKNVLRVAADPNNLPFSNARREGFENRVAALLARELDMQLEYVWRAQRRGFFRETLKEGTCDLVMGVPKDFERTLTTIPYYRSSYVFVSRRQRGLQLGSFDDAALRHLRIGVQLIGDDGVNTPPAHALATRGIITNVVGFTLYGNYAEENPPARIIEAVARGEIDVAIAWGPLAGYFASHQSEPLQLGRIKSTAGRPDLPMRFEICIGVRRSEKSLRDRLNAILTQKSSEIRKILADFGVPQDDEEQTARAASP